MKRPPAVTILTGELDLHASRSLGERLSAHVGAGVDAGDLILDLTTVSFIDSSALGALLQADQRLGRQGRGMAVVAPEGSPAAELIGLTHVDRRLSVHPTHEDAQAALAESDGAGGPEPATPSSSRRRARARARRSPPRAS